MAPAAEQQQPLVKKQRKIKEKKPLTAVPDVEQAVEQHASQSKFARALASPDFQTREKGLQALTRWLQRKDTVEPKDMDKIWKGLFYCFWHSDKAPVQAQLAERLASIITVVNDQVAFEYFTCFVATMRREWFGIDRLRLDKFLMLVRKFVGQALAHLQQRKWAPALVERFSAFLRAHVLLPRDHLRSASFAYHVADVFVPELLAVCSAPLSGGDASGGGKGKARPPGGETLRALLQPFCDALAAADDQPLINRVREGAFEPLLAELHQPSEGTPLGGLRVQELAAALFDAGAQPSVRARNREALYGLSEALERACRKRQRREGGAAGAAAAAAGPAPGKENGHAAAAATAAAPTPKSAAKASAKKAKAAAAAAAAASPAVQRMEVDGEGEEDDGEEGVLGSPTLAVSGVRLALHGGSGPGAEASGAPSTGKKKRKHSTAAAEEAETLAFPGTAAEEGEGAQPLQLQRGQGNASTSSTPQLQGRASSRRASGAVGARLPELAGGATPSQQQQQQQEGEQPPGSKAKTKSALKQKAAAAAAAASTPVASPAPSTSAKQQQQHAAAAAAGGSAGGPGSAVVSINGSVPMATRGSALVQRSAPHSAAPATAPKAGSAAAAGAAPPTTGKKRVQINLKKNLYFDFGGPVPDPMLRTPPTARSKGGILKRISSFGPRPRGGGPRSAPPKVGGSAAAAGAAQAEHAGQQGQPQAAGGHSKRGSQSAGPAKAGRPAAAQATPQRTPRAKASLFF